MPPLGSEHLTPRGARERAYPGLADALPGRAPGEEAGVSAQTRVGRVCLRMYSRVHCSVLSGSTPHWIDEKLACIFSSPSKFYKKSTQSSPWNWHFLFAYAGFLLAFSNAQPLIRNPEVGPSFLNQDLS